MSEKPPKIQPKRLRYNPDLPNGGYTDSQLHEQIYGKQVSIEFGLPCETLSNWRIHSKETGKQYGPPVFIDGDVNLYWRFKVVDYVQSNSYGFKKESSDSSESSDKKTKLEIVRDN